MRALRISITAALAGALLGAAAPRVATFARVARGPFTQIAQLPSPALWGTAAAVGLAGLAALLAEAVSRRRPPRALMPVLLLAALGVGLAPHEPPPWDRTPLLLTRAAAAIRTRGLQATAGVTLPATDFRDRRGRRVPAVLRVLGDRAGPMLRPVPGDAPGTLYLALARGARSGWLTGVTVASSGEPALIAQAGAPVIVPIGEEAP